MSRVPLPPAAEREDKRRARTSLLVASLLVCLALLAGLWGWNLYRQHHPTAGPLAPRGQAAQVSTASIPVGGSGVGTVAVITLTNPTTTPAVIDAVRLVPPAKGKEARLVGGWIARPVGGEVWGAFSGPPEQHFPDHQPADGMQIPPRSGDFVLGLTLGPGTSSTDALSSINGVDVRYHVGSRPYQARWPCQVVLCPGTTCAPWKESGQWPPKPTYGSK